MKIKSWLRKIVLRENKEPKFHEPTEQEIELGLLHMTLLDLGISEDKEFEMRKNSGLVGGFYRVSKEGGSDA